MLIRLSLIVALLATLAVNDAHGETPRPNAWRSATAAQRAEIDALCARYKAWLGSARTALASSATITAMARENGFVPFTSPAQVKPGARLVFPNRDRSLALAIVGQTPVTSGSRVFAAHQDSPHIDLKGRPVVAASDFALLKTIYYGYLKKYQWANVPLALVGRIDTAGGRRIDISVGLAPGDPVFVIPDIAPHSDTEQRTRTYTGVFTGEEMDPLAGSMPGTKTSVVEQVMNHLTQTYGIKEEDLVSAELQLVPAAPPADVGFDRAMVGGYGQDDRLSSWCAARGLLDVKGIPKYTAIVWLSNFEEVGSVNNTGAGSRFLESVYAELVAAQGGRGDLDVRHALRAAEVISADCCDAVNPLFPSSSETSNAARLGCGVAIKLYGRGFNAPSEFIARIRAMLDRHGIPWQTATPKVDVGGGGTIGGFMSAIDMTVIDLGVPLLSMHSPFEMSSKIDVWNFYRCARAFLGDQ